MSEIRVDLITEKTADGGVTIKSTGTGDNKPTLLTLQTSEADIAANDVLGKIQFQAPDEGTGTDAILVSAAIQARSEGDFAADANATSIDFMTGASEAAATKMTLSSAGVLSIDTISEKTSANGVAIDSLAIKDGKITNLMNATLSAADLGAGLHIKTADTGASVDGNADELVIEGTRSGLSILSANNDFGYILFGDDGSNNIGSIRYGHSANDLRIIVGGNEAMVIDATGAVTKPDQPAFLVHPASAQTNIADGATIVFGTERFDQNADFASNTFTAPVTGKYQINFTARIDAIDTDASHIRIYFISSNKTYEIIKDPNYTADLLYSLWNFCALIDMDASDTLHLEYDQNVGTQQVDFQSQSFLSGYLVC